jgi:PhnB protein
MTPTAVLAPYLFFDGNCAQAMRFYERLLEGKMEIFMTHGEAPEGVPMPPGSADRILHAHLAFPGGVLLASDGAAGQHEGMKGFSVSYSCDSPERAERLFAALSDGGTVRMPFQKTFWARGFGMCVDRFGTPWMVNAGDVGGAQG